MNEIYDVLIIGSGPAGLTSAIYAARANLKPLVIAGMEPGGQLMTTTIVENFPGFPDGVNGPDLMQNMIKQAERFGARFVYDVVSNVDFSKNNSNKTLKVVAGNKEYFAKSVIIATGSSPRKLGISSEQQFWGRGLSTCATCDGAFYKDKTVAVVGGGDSAAEESTFLTRFAKKVYLVHRRDSLRASQIMQDRFFGNEKIEVLWNKEVKDIVGTSTVTKIVLFDNKSNKQSDLPVDGIFLAIGHIPNTSFLYDALEKDEAGFVKVKNGTHTQTNIDGVYVAGDVHDSYYQQAITASGMGCMAAMDVEKYLASIT
ncbi:thioredoxin-disulfide reductase [candidate division WWE3 bacterium CG10_big_fil_rev_8_21_14_0_10_32_10]|uniref:Thioredoxin reductase n=1 Tax=candidate division WWE3 bacterium CG10_big_fil_rev_8_21_14_0_10_32_10 TaxID=1975090 RepID=A0A2H0RBK0_UNCKA|nr:MAG: thioredoxin-disulfide reductase [candidate division WWE3 bacterium CG10_big_fil_rev_8_21_14_0_10_32_10]